VAGGELLGLAASGEFMRVECRQDIQSISCLGLPNNVREDGGKRGVDVGGVPPRLGVHLMPWDLESISCLGLPDGVDEGGG